MLDSTGADVGLILSDAATTHGIPVLLLLTCGIAESALNPNAFRNGVWPDVSCGPFQQTVAFSPFGDQSASAANIAANRVKFADWAYASDVAASLLSNCYQAATSAYPSAIGDQVVMLSLSKYNSGSVQPPGNWWWQGPGKANYAAALAEAHAVGVA